MFIYIYTVYVYYIHVIICVCELLDYRQIIYIHSIMFHKKIKETKKIMCE